MREVGLQQRSGEALQRTRRHSASRMSGSVERRFLSQVLCRRCHGAQRSWARRGRDERFADIAGARV